MKYIHAFGYKGRFARLTAITLAFFIVLTPLAPVFAQEVTTPEQTVSEPTESSDSSATDPAATEESTTEETKAPIEEDPISPESNSMMGSQSGPEFNLTSSSIKSHLPDVDKANGSLVYQYPLNVPPGRNGMQPDLKLVYNSQGGEDGKIFGDRWFLNIPSIERINRKGTDKLYTEDLFSSSMDGELVLVDPGIYGAKIENGSFLKYSYSSSAWTVTDKTGTVYKFGTTTSSRLNNPSDSTKIYRWMLDEVRDLNNNYIKYEYYKDQGEIYPSNIIYTGNNTTDGIFEVGFTRSFRTNPIVTARPGFTIKAAYYISEIVIKIDNSWVRKYTFAYAPGDNGQANILLNTITETGRDESANTIAMPVEDYDHQVATTSGSSWTNDTNWDPPVDTTEGLIVADVNGDGLDDLVQGYYNGSTTYKRSWLNNGAGWTLSNDFVPPIIFQDQSNDEGVRLIDVNGDGLADIIRKKSGVSGESYLNNGTGWTSTTNWTAPADFAGGSDTTRVGEFNGDGLPDVIKNGDYVYLNNGTTGWTNANWTVPVNVKNGVIITDVNGDGLDDLVQSWATSPTVVQTWLNNGTSFTSTTDFASPVYFSDGSYKDEGVRALDVNGDGLADLLKYQGGPGGVQASYLNNGTGWTFTSYWNAPLEFVYINNNSDTGTRLGDFDGDGKIDFMRDHSGINMYFHQKKKANLISKITYPRGGNTEVVYQGSAQYKSGSTYLNPSLPMVLVTVKTITNDDGFNLDSVYEYTHEGGKYYYTGAFDRKFSGFAKITKTDSAGNKVKTFFHQGDSTNRSQGEYSDDDSKIGKIYRVEITDSSSNIYLKKVSKWENYDLDDSNDFVKLTRTTELTYDGDSDHKDKASTYTYDNASGNLTEQVDLGEVTGSDDGSYTDTGTDKFTTTITYASNTGSYILGLPKQETVVDQSSNKVRESKYYYDAQAHGSVNKGNLTKEEKWKTGTTYVDIEKTYNSTYGTLASSIDERNKTTTYSNDSYNLYPASITNPLSQVTSYTYDYSIGKPKQTTDVNSRVFQSVFDALDRVIEEKQPDLTTPSTLVTKTTYTYTNETIGLKTKKTAYLDSATTVDIYTYTDGFDRLIQTRNEMEDGNYATTDVVYNNVEQIYKESLPYSSSGTSRTSATTTASLLATYSYDPMLRRTTTVNAVGTITNAYDDWKQTITDPRSKVKHLYRDAHDNLIKVDEINSSNTYTTNYEYDGNKKLTKITDALSNVRNFTYDGLGRRLTAQDLHASADTSYGSWSYTYDDAGNLTSVTDPKSQQIDYTYDDINRRLTENYTGQAGTEITYTYDFGTDGVGRLTSVTATGANTTYAYNPHGKLKQEVKTINSTNYQTDYTYDRQGNNLEITNPDSSKVRYSYNTAGQLERVETKESTASSYSDVVVDFDYSPTGKVSYMEYANGAETTNTYDSTKLYRLLNIYTTTRVEGMGGQSFGEMEFLSSLFDPFINSDEAESMPTEETPSVEEPVLEETPVEEPVTEEPIEAAPLEEPIVEQPVEEAPAAEPTVEPIAEEQPVAAKPSSTCPANIRSELQDKNAKDRAKIKANKTAQCSVDGIYTSEFGLTIEIKELEELELNGLSGVQLYARAWKNNKPLGFSKDGSVEWERFIVYNPPILVPDENGDIVDEFTDERGQTIRRVLREDPKAALQQVIAHNVSLVGKHDAEVTKGKRGSTVSTFYPDANTETTSVDGVALRDVNNESWSTIHDSTGNGITDDGTGGNIAKVQSGNQSSKWNNITRGIFLFDTSAIIDNYTIDSATLSFYGLGKWNDSSNSPTFNVFTSNPASNTALVNADYTTLGTTALSTAITYSSWSTSSYNDFALNSTGLAQISKTGVSKFGTREASYDAANSEPTWGNSKTIEAGAWFADRAGTSQDPKLVVTHSAPPNSAPSASTSLQTEGQTNPINITDITPEFSAIYNDVDVGDTATHYQIQVSTASNFSSIFWDSTKTSLPSSVTQGNRTADISYAGSTLAQATTYYWRIKLWDAANAESAWSTETATFSLLDTNDVPTAPTSLKTEGQTNPTGLLDPDPEFTAIYNDNDTTDTATHYRVQVSTVSNFSSTVWDSGQTLLLRTTTQGERSTSIEYGGSALTAATTYYWRIKFWDDDTLEGAWSTESATFTIAITSLTVHQDIDYAYDANSNVTQIVEAATNNSSRTVEYVFDDLNRLTSATATNVASGQSTYTHTYTYDAIGNLLTRSDSAGTYTYGGSSGTNYANPHHPTSIGSINYTYDNNGNMLTETSGLSNTWNYRNQVTQAVKGGVTSTYDYDHDGQRVRLANGTTTTYYPSKFYNIEGTNRVKHIFAGNRMVATVTGTGGSAVVYSVHTDHLTGANIVTNSTPSQQELLDYFPYGNIRLDQKAGSFDEQRKFAGSEYDSDTTLNYMGARYYHSAISKFISEDLMFLDVTFDLTDPQSMNSTAYARNNPLRYNDPDGKWFKDVIMGRQSWNDFVPEVGEAANYLYDNNSAWKIAMNHPVAAGAVVGVAGGLATVGGAAAVPYLPAVVQSPIVAPIIRAGTIGAGGGLATQAISDAVNGQVSSPGAYGGSAMRGAAIGIGAQLYGPIGVGIVGGGASITSDLYDNRSVSVPNAVGKGLLSAAGAKLTNSANRIPGRLPNPGSTNYYTGKHAKYEAMKEVVNTAIDGVKSIFGGIIKAVKN